MCYKIQSETSMALMSICNGINSTMEKSCHEINCERALCSTLSTLPDTKCQNAIEKLLSIIEKIEILNQTKYRL